MCYLSGQAMVVVDNHPNLVNPLEELEHTTRIDRYTLQKRRTNKNIATGETSSWTAKCEIIEKPSISRKF